MSELISVNDIKLLDFGNFTSEKKLKESMEFMGDQYNIKTYNEVTRLEKNDLMIYESVPGTEVSNFLDDIEKISFRVKGNGNTSIILAVEENKEFKFSIDGIEYENNSLLAQGKLNVNVDLNEDWVEIEVNKYDK